MHFPEDAAECASDILSKLEELGMKPPLVKSMFCQASVKYGEADTSDWLWAHTWEPEEL